MAPGTQIAPHYGACNLKLRCHLPIIVPEAEEKDLYLRVGADTVTWFKGNMIVFDDCYEHEAGNLAKTGDRVVLLIDIWHPDLSKYEIQAIQEMFQQMNEMMK